jgi:hypothetical protein
MYGTTRSWGGVRCMMYQLKIHSIVKCRSRSHTPSLRISGFNPPILRYKPESVYTSAVDFLHTLSRSIRSRPRSYVSRARYVVMTILYPMTDHQALVYGLHICLLSLEIGVEV